MQVKGFTMIQCLIALAIASITSLFTSVMVRPIHLGISHIFYGKALYTQVLSIFDQSYQNMESIEGCDFNELFYYPSGTVNKAQAVHCGNRELIVHLGNGNIE